MQCSVDSFHVMNRRSVQTHQRDRPRRLPYAPSEKGARVRGYKMSGVCPYAVRAPTIIDVRARARSGTQNAIRRVASITIVTTAAANGIRKTRRMAAVAAQCGTERVPSGQSDSVRATKKKFATATTGCATKRMVEKTRSMIIRGCRVSGSLTCAFVSSSRPNAGSE